MSWIKVKLSPDLESAYLATKKPGEAAVDVLRRLFGLPPRQPKAPRPQHIVESRRARPRWIYGSRLYPELNTLAPGESVVVPWTGHGLGEYRIRRAVLRLAKKNGWILSSWGTPRGLIVRRAPGDPSRS